MIRCEIFSVSDSTEVELSLKTQHNWTEQLPLHCAQCQCWVLTNDVNSCVNLWVLTVECCVDSWDLSVVNTKTVTVNVLSLEYLGLDMLTLVSLESNETWLESCHCQCHCWCVVDQSWLDLGQCCQHWNSHWHCDSVTVDVLSLEDLIFDMLTLVTMSHN